MELIYNKIFLEHDTGMHPENRKRLDCLGELKETNIGDGERYLSLFHKKQYIEKVKEFCRKGRGHLDNDTVVSEKSYEAAVKAVAATVLASEKGDFALVRPPGHHAHPGNSSGFCVFNNIAIAVQRLVNEGKKILIFDFDAHLGDGTVKFFYDSDNVLYWSLHQSPAFPGGGDVDDIGDGKGKGYTINIPLPAGTGDDIYRKAIETMLPAAKQFDPDAVAVSAGFDGHHSDLLLDLRLSMDTYHWMGNMLRKNFKNIFATFEGGYNTQTLPGCINNFLDGINGKKKRFKEQHTESDIKMINEMEFRIDKLERNLKKYWRL